MKPLDFGNADHIMQRSDYKIPVITAFFAVKQRYPSRYDCIKRGISYGGSGGIRTHEPLRTTAFRVKVLYLYFREKQRTEQPIVEADKPSNFKAFRAIRRSELKKPLCCKEFEYFPVLSRFRGEKSLLGRIRGERHSSITKTTAQKTPTVN